MSVEFSDYQTELRKREFNLRCNIIRKKVDFHDDAYEGNSHADLVLLEPLETTEYSMFLSAYYSGAMPLKNAEGFLTSKIEIPCFASMPIGQPTMVRLNWPNELHQKPHLMVISVAIEHLINSYKEISSIELKVFPHDMADKLNLYSGHVRI